MGWKNIKEHYRIDHQMQVTQDGICIGSPYIHNIIVVSPEGKIVKQDDRTLNDKLGRYQAEMQADPAKLKELVVTPDTFSASIPVFTYEGAEIIEKFCEALGWPNVTHDGRMMYENTYFKNREDALDAAKRNCEAAIMLRRMELSDKEKRTAEVRARLQELVSDARKLGMPAADDTAAPQLSSRVTVTYAYCCNGPVKYCDCTNPSHGTATMGANEAGDDYAVVDPAPAPSSRGPIELDGVAERVAVGDGFWRSCSGCHELNEGVPTGPYSDIMKCHLGMGCRECGGIGAIWDGTDYSVFGVEPEPVDLSELPDDVRQAAIIAFNTAADVPQWGGGEPYLIIGRAIMAGRTPPAEKLRVTGFRGNPLRVVLSSGDEATVTQKLVDAFASPSPFGQLEEPGQAHGDRRHTFVIPEGYLAVRDDDGRATGEVRPIPSPDAEETEESCPVCIAPFKPDDLCVTDIELGICHAECLDGSPVVDLDTGEPIPDGKMDIYRFDDTDPAAPTSVPTDHTITER